MSWSVLIAFLLAPLRPMYFLSIGNKSDSSAASQSTTHNTDKRQVVDGQSTAQSLDINLSGGSGKRANVRATIQVLDGGAISRAFKYAKDTQKASLAFAEETAADLLGFTESTAAAMTDSMKKSRELDAKVLDSVADLAGGQKTLVIGVLIIGGILALKFLGKKK